MQTEEIPTAHYHTHNLNVHKSHIKVMFGLSEVKSWTKMLSKCVSTKSFPWTVDDNMVTLRLEASQEFLLIVDDSPLNSWIIKNKQQNRCDDRLA